MSLHTATLLQSKKDRPYPRIAPNGQPMSAPAAVAKTATFRESNIQSVINNNHNYLSY